MGHVMMNIAMKVVAVTLSVMTGLDFLVTSVNLIKQYKLVRKKKGFYNMLKLYMVNLLAFLFFIAYIINY
jgi:hypothetical protein